jgi:GT2 family glycosyltransferase
MLRAKTLDEVGLFDEELWLFFNDVDLSLRMARAGWRTRYLADALVVHHVGASTSQFGGFVPEWHRNRLAYYRKHHGRLAGVWVKLCVGFTFADYALRNTWQRIRGREAEPVGPLLRDYLAFLWR